MKIKYFNLYATLVLFLLVLNGCEKTFELRSTAFYNNERIPDKYCHGGIGERQNVSLPFNWVNPPAGTRSFVLIIYHPHVSATKQNRICWAVVNIPADCNEIAENASGRNMPEGCIELSNFRRTTPPYYGPEPQPGGMVYDYIIELYALNTILDNISGYKSYLEISNVLEGKIIAKTQMLGTQSKERVASFF
jgi:Raf kinase inhibitor-like YbhB/YbcL family protein